MTEVADGRRIPSSLTHWGAFHARVDDGDIVEVAAPPGDTDPSPLLGNLPGAIRHESRVRGPAIRRGWLETGPARATGAAPTSSSRCPGTTSPKLLAGELRRVVDTHGNEAIYGGSYGWASAGRFHHAQSQVHRFLKLLGGYTFSRHSYSLGATGVIMPRVVGTHDDLFKRSTDWNVIAEHTDLLVCFGGVGLEEHRDQPRWHHRHIRPATHCAGSATAAARSCRSVPLRDDVDGDCRGWPRYPAPTWRSCWRWPMCWPPNPWPTAHSSTPTAPATTGSSAICSAPTTAAEIAAVGRGDLRAAADTHRTGPPDGRADARSSPSAGRCSASATASRRRGWA